MSTAASCRLENEAEPSAGRRGLGTALTVALRACQLSVTRQATQRILQLRYNMI